MHIKLDIYLFIVILKTFIFLIAIKCN